MSSDTESYELDAAQTVILNALVDLFAEEQIVLDDASAARLDDVVTEVTSEEQRSFVRDEFERLSTLAAGDSADIKPALHRFVVDVTDGMTDAGYSITVNHEYRQEIDPIDAHVYSFLNTGDTDRLVALDLDTAVEEALQDGLEAADADAAADAQTAFTAALESTTDQTDEIVAHIVAGWGHFKLDEDATALEHVEHALEIRDSSWAARVVGAAINRDEHDFIRSGKKSVGIILRWVAKGSKNTSTVAELGGRLNDEEVPWEELQHHGGHAFLEQIYPETWLRFRLRGDLPEFPHMQMYFLGLGVYDDAMSYIETVIDRFGTGPHNAGSIERISIER